MIPQDYLSAFTLPTIQNHTSREVIERAPWEGAVSVPPAQWSKVQVRRWHASPDTRHLYYSAYEGDNPTGRLSKENGPRLLRCIAVDYDCHGLPEDVLQATLDAVAEDLAPAFVSRSHSGGVHAVWMLEKPVWVNSPDLRGKLMAWFKRHLRLDKFLPGMDEKVYADAMIYFSAGTDWQQLDSKLITTTTTARALQECGSKATFRGHGVAVPLELVAEEVEARWPGRWQGEFVENARGVRFWDDSGDAMSVIVKPEGMLCYTGDKGFVDWATLLGKKFVEKFLDDKVGGAAESAWFDGRDYWIFAEATQAWRIAKSEEMTRRMKVKYALDATTGKGDTASEVDRALHHIAEVNLVRSAAPFVMRKPGILYIAGQRHLNVSSLKPCAPAEGECTPDDFPWIANYLDLMFCELENGHDPKEQLFRFLAWFQRAYKGALDYSPTQGHVVVIAGEVGSGKTLLGDVLIADALGGKKDATSFLMGESKFNKNLYHAPLWVVNDAQAASETGGKKSRYNALVKKVAANREFEMEAKFSDAVDVAWQGRLVITCNVDPESIQVMPQLDSSMSDKVLAFRAWGDDGDGAGSEAEKNARRRAHQEAKRFGNYEGKSPDQWIKHELPAFLNWLLRWEVPEWIARDARFGFAAWHHPELKAHAESSSQYSGFNEVLRTFLYDFFATRPEAVEWSGTATNLIEAMQGESSGVKNSAKALSSRGIGKMLANLVSRQRCHSRLNKGYMIYHFTKELWF